jgi:hypothetical protein
MYFGHSFIQNVNGECIVKLGEGVPRWRGQGVDLDISVSTNSQSMEGLFVLVPRHSSLVTIYFFGNIKIAASPASSSNELS